MVWWVIFIIGSVMIWKRTPRWKYQFDRFMLRVPVFWWIIQKVVLSKFARVLSWLLSSWVSIVESLRITSEALWNEAYRDKVMLVREDVKQWLKIWEALEWDKLFPVMFVQMIQVWEQTAQLDKIIIKVADFYDEEVDNLVWMINKLLEPFIIVFMAVVVWWIAIAIMQPIMNLADTISETVILL
jgi:type IV pilus assembly protein PilC